MKNVKMLILSMISAVVGLSASEESSTRLSAVEQLRSEIFCEYRKLFSQCNSYTAKDVQALRGQYMEKLEILAKLEDKGQTEQAKEMLEFLRSEDLGGRTPLMHVIGNYAKKTLPKNGCVDMLTYGLSRVDEYSKMLGEKADK